MNPTTDTQGPTVQDHLDAAAGERQALRDELAEMRRRRDAWKERANRMAAEREAARLAIGQITEDRDRVARQLAVAESQGVEFQARIAQLEGQLTTAVTVAESAELGWRNAAEDRDAETKRADRAEVFVSELALAIGQPSLRGQELLDHVRETEQLVAELRQVCAEQRHELRCAAEKDDRRKAELLATREALEAATRAAAPAEADR